MDVFKSLCSIFRSSEKPEQQNVELGSKCSDDELKVNSIGTDHFVVDVNSLFNSKSAQAQAEAASRLN